MTGILGLVGVGMVLLTVLCFVVIRRFRRSAALRWYGRPVTDVYTSIVVADTTYEELSSFDLGMCLLRAMILLDSRLVHYWCIEVAEERVSHVQATLLYHGLRRHRVRILRMGCSEEEAVTCCLEDKALQELWCPGCGGIRESLDVEMCAACTTFFAGPALNFFDECDEEEAEG